MTSTRMAGATAQQKEEAEASMRLSEDRFRSLIQNSSDTTMVMGAAGVCTYVSPAITELLGFEPTDLVGVRAHHLIHDEDVASVSRAFGKRGPRDPSLVFRARRDAYRVLRRRFHAIHRGVGVADQIILRQSVRWIAGDAEAGVQDG